MASQQSVDELCALNNRLKNITTLLAKGENLSQFFIVSPAFAASPEVVALADIIDEYKSQINIGFQGSMVNQQTVTNQAIANVTITGMPGEGPMP